MTPIDVGTVSFRQRSPRASVRGVCYPLAVSAAAVLLLAAGVPGAAAAGGAPTLVGLVTGTGGRPVGGALVTATRWDVKRRTTVYTDGSGRFRFPALGAGVYDLRVRRFGYRERTLAGQALGGRDRHVTLTIDPETDPRERAWQLPANHWFALARARLPTDDLREEFARQCTFCHQQGNWATRVQRSPEDWDKILALMGRMGGIVSPELRRVLPAALNAAYDEASYLPALAGAAPVVPPDEAAGAVITEWDLGHPASMQHDVTVHPDGSLYSVDLTQDKLYRLDPRTDTRTTWDIPRGESPLGGVFSGAALPPNATAHVAPHSLQVAPDGSIWITLCLGNKIGRFDPRTERWDIFEEFEGLYPHTLRFDQRGRVWYTLAISNHVGMIDPATGGRRTFRLPARTTGQAIVLRVLPTMLWLARWMPGIAELGGNEGLQLPIPYGIDVAPDGGVWFSQLNERRIGRIDPERGAIKMVETPFPGPRRLRFDAQGNLWIPGFSAALLARYDPSTEEFRSWPLPIAPAGSETPYALNVDRRTDTVWICGTNSDTLIRFEPGHERFTVFPLPTRVTYTREIDFDDAGGVWTSNSNSPTWQIEDGYPRVVRLEPEGIVPETRLAAQPPTAGTAP
jgi:virginiamycin B lyase